MLFSCDGDMVKKPNSILIQLGRKLAISERSQIELRLGTMHIPVALDESKRGGIFLDVCLIQHNC